MIVREFLLKNQTIQVWKINLECPSFFCLLLHKQLNILRITVNKMNSNFQKKHKPQDVKNAMQV
jgi:hypothetical protein